MGGPPTTPTCESIVAKANEIGAGFSQVSDTVNNQINQITS